MIMMPTLDYEQTAGIGINLADPKKMAAVKEVISSLKPESVPGAFNDFSKDNAYSDSFDEYKDGSAGLPVWLTLSGTWKIDKGRVPPDGDERLRFHVDREREDKGRLRCGGEDASLLMGFSRAGSCSICRRDSARDPATWFVSAAIRTSGADRSPRAADSILSLLSSPGWKNETRTGGR